MKERKKDTGLPFLVTCEIPKASKRDVHMMRVNKLPFLKQSMSFDHHSLHGFFYVATSMIIIGCLGLVKNQLEFAGISCWPWTATTEVCCINWEELRLLTLLLDWNWWSTATQVVGLGQQRNIYWNLMLLAVTLDSWGITANNADSLLTGADLA